jgi:hypothetical protein
MARQRVKLYVPKFQLCFPSLFEATSYAEGRPKFGCTAVWRPGDFTEDEKKLWATLLAALDAECQAVFKKSYDALRRLGNFKPGLRDGLEKEDLEGFGEGTVFASLTTQSRPGVVDWQRRPVEEGSPLVYPGCYARATVSPYAYKNVSNGVAIGLNNVQVLGGGPRLDGRTAAEDEFDAADYSGELDGPLSDELPF